MRLGCATQAREGSNAKYCRPSTATELRQNSSRALGQVPASYIGPDGKRHTAPTTFETRGDASAFLAEQQTKIRKVKWDAGPENAKPSSLTLAAYANPWLADRDLKPRTRALYRNLLDRRILPAFGDRPLAGITAADIRSWHADQAGASRPPGRTHTRCCAPSWSRCPGRIATRQPVPHSQRIWHTRRHRIEPATLPQLEVIIYNIPERYRL